MSYKTVGDIYDACNLVQRELINITKSLRNVSLSFEQVEIAIANQHITRAILFIEKGWKR